MLHFFHAFARVCFEIRAAQHFFSKLEFVLFDYVKYYTSTLFQAHAHKKRTYSIHIQKKILAAKHCSGVLKSINEEHAHNSRHTHSKEHITHMHSIVLYLAHAFKSTYLLLGIVGVWPVVVLLVPILQDTHNLARQITLSCASVTRTFRCLAIRT